MKTIFILFATIITLFSSVFVAAVASSGVKPQNHIFNSLKSNKNKREYPKQQQRNSSAFYSNWMGELAPIIANYTLMDISVPGTHDTMTFDLSTTIADNANDLPAWLSYIGHEFHGIISDLEIGQFIHDLAKTQGLTIREQLESGLRFVDCRIDYTAPPNMPSTAPYDWYSMHLVQSNNLAMSYLTEIRQFLADHPTEIVVIWISYHGTPTDAPFNAPNSALWSLWNQITTLYDGIMYDFSKGLLNETSIQTMLNRGHRAVFYMSNYTQMTNSSNFAEWAAHIDNDCPSDSNPVMNIQNFIHHFDDALTRQQNDKAQNNYYLMSMSGPTIEDHFIYAFELRFLSKLPTIFNQTEEEEKCAALYKVPGCTTWCPQYLQENSQWSNYYAQHAFEHAINAQIQQYQSGNGKQKLTVRFPNAIYIDAMDVNGTIRTGSQIFGPPTNNSNNNNNNGKPVIPSFEIDQLNAKYSYTDTLLLSNVMLICSGTVGPTPSSAPQPPQDICSRFVSMLTQRRAQYPIQLWDDLSTGRSSTYPPKPYF